MWFAEMSTRNFTFTALALSRREALDAIRNGLVKHAKACKVPAAPLLEYAGEGEEQGDINVLEMTPGRCYLDGDHEI